MKNLLATLFMLMCTVAVWAQGTITGTVLDSETEESLIGATVYLEGTPMGTTTDIDGNFSIANVDAGTYTLIISYTGYSDKKMEVNSASGNIGTVSLAPTSIGLSEVNVIASVAVDRKTPVAVTTIKGSEVEALVGNQEYPEILKKSPSVYVTKQGGGFGDSRINVRGFDQRNLAVMINGIPVNDMENGWVYWSNWAGLSDVTSNLQIQRGLGASKLAIPSVGGSINIITNAAEMRKSAKVSLGVGNDGYQKYGLMLSSGLLDNGLAATLQMTHTEGDGYIDGTKFNAWSYFLSLSKTFNSQHTIAFTALGAPQWHHQRTLSNFDNVTIGTFRRKGIKYNPRWGMLNGEEFTWRKNFYHKPKIFLNHYWTISENTDVKTSAYVSLGRGGGTGPRGRLRTPGSVFDSYSADGQGTFDENGQVRFDDIVAYNQGATDFNEEWGTKLPASSGALQGQFVNTSNGKFMGSGEEGSGFIRRASMNSHNWYGVLSTLTHRLNSNLTLTAGIDGRYYKGIHYRRLENLLGADGYLSQSDDNMPERYLTEESPADFFNFGDNSYQDANNPNVLNYHNDGIVTWAGIFGQLEYSTDAMTAFASLSGSQQGFKRVDYFNYLDSDPEQSSDFVNHMGGNIKAGINFNLTDQTNVYFNGGFISKQPIFDNVFVNFRNDINEDAKNQTISAFEAGYGYRSGEFMAKINAYTTLWSNRQQSFGTTILVNGDEHDGTVNLENIAQRHSGVEIEVAWTPVRRFTFTGMGSFGSWKYADNFTGNIYDIDEDRLTDQEFTLYMDGVNVGDAAQTTMRFGLDHEILEGLNFYGDVLYFARIYADYNINEPVFRIEPLYPNQLVTKLPSYVLVNTGISYKFNLGAAHVTARLNVNNLMDTLYIAELDTNGKSLYHNREQGFFGFGRTWNAGLKFAF